MPLIKVGVPLLSILAFSGFALAETPTSTLNATRLDKDLYDSSTSTSPSLDEKEVIEIIKSYSSQPFLSNDDFDGCLSQVADDLCEIIKIRITDVLEDNELYDSFIDYIKEQENTIIFESAMLRFFSSNECIQEKLAFIDMVLSSNIDIFCNWYKNILLLASRSANKTLSFRASDILSYYQSAFDEVNHYGILR